MRGVDIFSGISLEAAREFPREFLGIFRKKNGISGISKTKKTEFQEFLKKKTKFQEFLGISD
jgi:hypothetical protein